MERTDLPWVASTRQGSFKRVSRLEYSPTGSAQNSAQTVTAAPGELYALRRAVQDSGFPTQTDRHRWQAVSSRPADVSGVHSAPISPLRDRDFVVLSTLFLRNDMYEIEADIGHCLLSLLPEPCWEEDPFEFLQEFLECST